MISFCVTSFNRFEFTVQSFEQILHDDRVSEIIISDDASTDNSFLHFIAHFMHEQKVKIFRNETNQDCFRNKKTAIELASNHFCILGDSDNVFGVDYLDVIFDYLWDKNVILTPSWAAPHFDFRDYEGLLITKENVAKYIDKPMFEVCLNAANYFVNRQSFLDSWDGSINPVTSDSIWVAYNWLKDGKGIFVTPNLTYTHRVHNGSHYQNNKHRTEDGLHEQILTNLRNMK